MTTPLTLQGLARNVDVLVIGGGMAGAWAASAAARQGARVILVDKGYCGTSGVTAASGPGHWFVPPAGREQAVAQRVAAGLGLGEAGWMHRILDETWRVLPTLAPYYHFGTDDQGVVNYRAVRGPEYMRALRAQIEDLGVEVLDHSPALELLADEDGTIWGAQGIQRQRGGQPWRVTAAGVVLAAGGTSFLSNLLGSRVNTGDGYLLAAEAGCALSGMEFTAAYTVAPAHTTMTRAMSYAYARYFDESGHEIDTHFFQPGHTAALARALLRGRLYCSLKRLPEDIRQHLPTISPNVMLTFQRLGIDPFQDRFEVQLHNDGTIRGMGGVEVRGTQCETAAAGLFVAGDTASREKVAGAISGGGNINAAWALSSGSFAGSGAAARALRLGSARPRLVGLGRAGLHPASAIKPLELGAVRQAVKDEMHPFDKNLFRTGAGLAASAEALAPLWREVSDHAAPGLAAREAAALIATARWSLAAAWERRESRGMHQRIDAPGQDDAFAGRLLVDGFDVPRVRHDRAPAILEHA